MAERNNLKWIHYQSALEKSGLNIREFCEENGLNFQTAKRYLRSTKQKIINKNKSIREEVSRAPVSVKLNRKKTELEKKVRQVDFNESSKAFVSIDNEMQTVQEFPVAYVVPKSVDIVKSKSVTDLLVRRYTELVQAIQLLDDMLKAYVETEDGLVVVYDTSDAVKVNETLRTKAVYEKMVVDLIKYIHENSETPSYYAYRDNDIDRLNDDDVVELEEERRLKLKAELEERRLKLKDEIKMMENSKTVENNKLRSELKEVEQAIMIL